jgi:hypothetical protein
LKLVIVAPPPKPPGAGVAGRSAVSVRARSDSRAGVCCSASICRDRGVASGSLLGGAVVVAGVDGAGCWRRRSCASAGNASVEIRKSVKTVFLANMGRDCIHFFMYFQFLGFPSAIHSTAWSRRRFRVSSDFASVIHWTYSRRWLGEKLS